MHSWAAIVSPLCIQLSVHGWRVLYVLENVGTIKCYNQMREGRQGCDKSGNGKHFSSAFTLRLWKVFFLLLRHDHACICNELCLLDAGSVCIHVICLCYGAEIGRWCLNAHVNEERVIVNDASLNVLNVSIHRPCVPHLHFLRCVSQHRRKKPVFMCFLCLRQKVYGTQDVLARFCTRLPVQLICCGCAAQLSLTKRM